MKFFDPRTTSECRAVVLEGEQQFTIQIYDSLNDVAGTSNTYLFVNTFIRVLVM